MPRPTSDFAGEPDYAEAAMGARRGTYPVFFGTRYARNRYSRGLGRRLTDEDSLARYFASINRDGEDSEYFGCVLYPERESHRGSRADPAEWTYEKNQAFWAGIIDNRQELVLVTDIKHYTFLTGTVDELLWLEDNGYTFRPDLNDLTRTLAVPPERLPGRPQIKDYGNGEGLEGNEREMSRRLDNIKDTVLAARELLREERVATASATTASIDRSSTWRAQKSKSGWRDLMEEAPSREESVTSIQSTTTTTSKERISETLSEEDVTAVPSPPLRREAAAPSDEGAGSWRSQRASAARTSTRREPAPIPPSSSRGEAAASSSEGVGFWRSQRASAARISTRREPPPPAPPSSSQRDTEDPSTQDPGTRRKKRT